ncbi:6-carboxyhexanoate--CoA ligase [Collibacillus ludicampi]|uniref:6-carboxyhexanoate--CoA ligase n=1 Tax=Collibacillus ludicampi TaxID=2771369 RepID=A0AAV4LGT5_9BACL|nr:6-carboxyhexanoate--CoA ligase [Collibacillus ludicampi]GIM46873.1 6-carboxyhexanoate--CoA ligase [Collibacillus ludicampi]
MGAVFSVRMRASQESMHISGGERLAEEERVREIAHSLIERALTHERGGPDSIHLTIDKMDRSDIQSIAALPISTIPVRDVHEGYAAAQRKLVEAGIPSAIAAHAIDLLKKGPGPQGTVMRGAVLMDVQTGERLEPDIARGVRVSRFDWKEETLRSWMDEVSSFGFNRSRIWEAIALASKVAAAPGVLAEICWSDDPSYVTGYVSSPSLGYVRIPHLKEKGDPVGGRIFFVDRQQTDISTLIHYLEKQAVWIDQLPENLIIPSPQEIAVGVIHGTDERTGKD